LIRQSWCCFVVKLLDFLHAPSRTISPVPVVSIHRRAQVLQGFNLEEALSATRHPCAASTLYRKVAAKREELRKTARDGTSDYLNDNSGFIVAAREGDQSEISSLSPGPSPRKRQKTTGLHPISEAIERGVRDGVNAFASTVTATASQAASASASRHSGRIRKRKADSEGGSVATTTTLTRSTPRRTPRQVNYQQCKDKDAKHGLDGRYKDALKEGTLLYQSRSNQLSLRIIANKCKWRPW
jgi:hypothetical protein